jgi:hypothetical protein
VSALSPFLPQQLEKSIIVNEYTDPDPDKGSAPILLYQSKRIQGLEKKNELQKKYTSHYCDPLGGNNIHKIEDAPPRRVSSNQTS